MSNEIWITTFPERKRINLLEFSEADVSIEHIASSLSKKCRYNGACPIFYSVAEHSIRVFNYVVEYYREFRCERPGLRALKALLHDSSESLLGDWISPIKHSGLMSRMLELEENIEAVIFRKYKLDEFGYRVDDVIKWADKKAYEWEQRYLFSGAVKERPWQEVCEEFLQKFEQYSR